MSSDSRLPEYLPQYGFGPETEFKTLVEKNPFLFRLHTPRASRDPFTALPFEGSHTSDVRRQSLDPPLATYSDVIRHMDWTTTRHTSPYISASFSFMWAIWEALRRYHFGVKHDVEIAVIDATAISRQSITVVELMRSVAFTECVELDSVDFLFA
ncbi:hypothetical protein B0H11DRAFT_2255543 [Mycena galericulata]|nr:hypothetical protein B0H11DRAFT_2255543 [Mycena galericulata]